MNTTDYTKLPKPIQPPVLPSRFGAYLLDLLKSWFSDPRNRVDPKLSGLTYIDGESAEAIDESKVYLDVEWPDDQRLVGKTPAVIVTFGQTTIQTMGIGGNNTYIGNTKFPGSAKTFDWSYTIALNIRTSAYAGCQYITELLSLYLATYSDKIKDDSGLSGFYVNSFTSPNLQKTPWDSKDVFSSTIVLTAKTRYTAVVDTTGPTFRGVTVVNSN